MACNCGGNRGSIRVARQTSGVSKPAIVKQTVVRNVLRPQQRVRPAVRAARSDVDKHRDQ